MSVLPLHFVDGQAGTCMVGSIRAGWTPEEYANLYLIRSEFHHATHARNDSLFSSKVVRDQKGKPTGDQRLMLHDHIREWCVAMLGYDPEFGETYLNFYRDGKETYDEFRYHKVYNVRFNNETHRLLFRMKWQSA